MYSPDRFLAALRFATEKHLPQKFPGTDLPYLMHVVTVASEVIAHLPALKLDDPDLAVACALLHDTLEDTPATYEEVAAKFGRAVADGVDALVRHTRQGRIRAGLDVTDPEPLPQDHPLWGVPGVLIAPHVGGASSAMKPRVVALLRRQIAHLLVGETPENIVIGA